jgi:hypothetical protein
MPSKIIFNKMLYIYQINIIKIILEKIHIIFEVYEKIINYLYKSVWVQRFIKS